jgi:hypothetical protein
MGACANIEMGMSKLAHTMAIFVFFIGRFLASRVTVVRKKLTQEAGTLPEMWKRALALR